MCTYIVVVYRNKKCLQRHTICTLYVSKIRMYTSKQYIYIYIPAFYCQIYLCWRMSVIYLFSFVCICLCLRTCRLCLVRRAYTHICVCLCVCAHVHIYVYTCVYIPMYICTFVIRMCICFIGSSKCEICSKITCLQCTQICRICEMCVCEQCELGEGFYCCKVCSHMVFIHTHIFKFC